MNIEEIQPKIRSTNYYRTIRTFLSPAFGERNERVH